MRRSIETGLVVAIAAWAVWMWMGRREEAKLEEERARALMEAGAVVGGVVEAPLVMLAAADTGFAGRVAVVGEAMTGAEVCASPVDGVSTDLAVGFRCAAADSDGSYRLLGLAPGAYRLAAAADGFLPLRWSPPEEVVTVRRGELREGVDFTLTLRGEAVRGVVRDTLGGAIAGALVRSQVGGLAHSDAEGRFTVWAPAAVETRVEVMAAGHATAVVVVRAPEAARTISLAPEVVLRGQVVRAEGGGPLVGLAVQLEVERVAAVSDEDGRFEVRGLAAGERRPFVRSEGWCGEAVTDATVESVTIAARRCVEAELGPVLP